MNEFVVVYERDEDGWTASVPDLPGCFSDAETLEEAQYSIRRAVQLWMETAMSNGWPILRPQALASRIAV